MDAVEIVRELSETRDRLAEAHQTNLDGAEKEHLLERTISELRDRLERAEAEKQHLHEIESLHAKAEAERDRLAEALGITLPGFMELHAQDIGCSGCPDDKDTTDPRNCPAVVRAEAALAELTK